MPVRWLETPRPQPATIEMPDKSPSSIKFRSEPTRGANLGWIVVGILATHPGFPTRMRSPLCSVKNSTPHRHDYRCVFPFSPTPVTRKLTELLFTLRARANRTQLAVRPPSGRPLSVAGDIDRSQGFDRQRVVLESGAVVAISSGFQRRS